MAKKKNDDITISTKYVQKIYIPYLFHNDKNGLQDDEIRFCNELISNLGKPFQHTITGDEMEKVEFIRINN